MAGIGAAILVLTLGTASRSATASETRAFTGGRVAIQVGAGDVEVRGGARSGTVEITRRSTWGIGATKPALNESWGGEALEIETPECSGISWRCSVDYVLRVPDGMAVTVDTGSGSVVVGGSLAAVQLQTGSGDVDGARELSTSNLDVRTGSGNIDLDLRSGGPVVLRAGSGNVDLRVAGEALAGDLDVETGSGNVAVDVPDSAPVRLDVQTGSGDEQINHASDPHADRVVRVRTGSGEADVR